MCISPAAAGPKDKHAHDDCPGCKEMNKTGEGWCGHCKVGMVCHVDVKDEKVYKAMKDSSYAKCVEKGEKIKASEIKCDGCRKMADSHKDGFCKKCDGGMVAAHWFKGKDAYEKAEHCMSVLRSAAKAKCDGCAIAMVGDGKCDHCKVSYKDGKKAKSGA
jgi:hypothetical protein